MAYKPEELLRKSAIANRKMMSKRRQLLWEIKLASGCVDCGYNANPVALDFDHMPGTEKLFSVGSHCCKNWEAVLAEIEKCEVVCANCHRIRTFERKQSGPARIHQDA